jgi:hypothetical protein
VQDHRTRYEVSVRDPQATHANADAPEAPRARCVPVRISPGCYKFLHELFKGTPSVRQAVRLRPSSDAEARAHRGIARSGLRTMPGPGGGSGQLADSGAGGMPLPDRREPSGRGAAARSGRPHPQAGSPRRNASPMTARTDRAVLLARGILSPRQTQHLSGGRPAGPDGIGCALLRELHAATANRTRTRGTYFMAVTFIVIPPAVSHHSRWNRPWLQPSTALGRPWATGHWSLMPPKVPSAL